MKNLNLIILIILITLNNPAIAQQSTSIIPNFQIIDTNYSAHNLELHSFMRDTDKQLKHVLYEFYDFGYITTKKPFQTRLYMQSFKISSGYSLCNTRSDNILKSYQDTTSNVFTFNRCTPILSFSHEIATNSRFSIAYSIGYQRASIDLNRKSFGSNKFLIFINPRLTTFRKNRFETYFQLKIGAIYDDKKMDNIESNAIRYILPTNLKMYTGFTPLGINYMATKRVSLNLEWSIWAFETFSFGLKYNFSKNEND